ncbi:TIM29 translocase, partial [Pardalotus punctatus]|nr:TIM29 translocase [Pardalotus punctatus]
GFVALAGVDPHGREPALYSASCPHLRPRIWDLGVWLLDVGFLGRWWRLEEAMRDCDVNEEEFRDFPEELRRMESGELRSER